MGDKVIREVRCAQKQALDLVIEAQLTDGHEHSSTGGPVHSIEQLLDTLLSRYSYQTINSVLVTKILSK